MQGGLQRTLFSVVQSFMQSQDSKLHTLPAAGDTGPRVWGPLSGFSAALRSYGMVPFSWPLSKKSWNLFFSFQFYNP